jgi:16S rRNA (uracil1498-N3)-methyltransferase
MPPARFYVDTDLALGEPVVLPPAVAHHAVRVLRLRHGASITLFNGRGGEYEGRLHVVGKRTSALLERFDPIERESPLRLTLVQAWAASDKIELIVEKAVELGVAGIVLVPAVRSVVQLDGPRLDRRLQRLREIVVAACSQCGRNRLAEVRAATTLQDGLESALSGDARGLLLDPHAAGPLATALSAQVAVSLAVGPEGGFDDGERALALRLGYGPMRLGPRILRTETAGLVGLVALQVLGGDLQLPRAGGSAH